LKKKKRFLILSFFSKFKKLILQAKKLIFFGLAVIEILFRTQKLMTLTLDLTISDLTDIDLSCKIF